MQPARPDDTEAIPRKKRKQTSGDFLFVCLLIVTIFIPLVGIIVGAVDYGRGGRRGRQGAAMLAVGLVLAVVYTIAMASK